MLCLCEVISLLEAFARSVPDTGRPPYMNQGRTLSESEPNDLMRNRRNDPGKDTNDDQPAY
jgi:hypothetical protein